jgi:hypothetical protein
MTQFVMTPEQLRQRLAEATEARRALYERGRNSHVELARYLAAEEAVLRAERDLAAAKGDQYAVPLDLGFEPSSAVTNPSLQQDEYSAILRFNAVAKRPDGTFVDGTAEVTFASCSITKFGYPNDDALPGHPLYGRGLSPYGIFQVHNSEWDRALREQNLVSFPNGHQPAGTDLHLVFSFHDSTFECICASIGSSRFTSDPDSDSR